MAISATPSQTDAVSPTTPHKSDAIKRWQKLHNTHKAVHLLNHEVKHEFAHRAQEKAFFGLANQGLARARNTLVRTAKPQHALVTAVRRQQILRTRTTGLAVQGCVAALRQCHAGLVHAQLGQWARSNKHWPICGHDPPAQHYHRITAERDPRLS